MSFRFDTKSSLWVASHARYPNFVATSDAPFVTMLLGPHPWKIYNDSALCSGETYKRSILLVIFFNSWGFSTNTEGGADYHAEHMQTPMYF